MSKSHAEYMRKWRLRNLDKAREISRVSSAKHRAENLVKVRKSSVQHNARYRAKIFEFFGGVCIRCGFSDPRALQMDHIHGNGNKERKNGCDLLHQRYRFIVEHPDEAREKFQLLCANCNCIKRVENKEYGNGSSNGMYLYRGEK